ncbi:hypothetical protein HMPREF0663_11957 [Hoylesella oralis ATCC 33269]|uniref:Uncharacterized protein n=1 Tax=Hoylesella oralis ATCC 33269 TaxID=873533 RepID=E7RT84_9BACT|nr:hypothetical protein HMPREF0663_11957 [Hoylesella oralis ATCC 33269]
MAWISNYNSHFVPNKYKIGGRLISAPYFMTCIFILSEIIEHN